MVLGCISVKYRIIALLFNTEKNIEPIILLLFHNEEYEKTRLHIYGRSGIIYLYANK